MLLKGWLNVPYFAAIWFLLLSAVTVLPVVVGFWCNSLCVDVFFVLITYIFFVRKTSGRQIFMLDLGGNMIVGNRIVVDKIVVDLMVVDMAVME